MNETVLSWTALDNYTSNHSYNQSINRSINQSISQSINQSRYTNLLKRSLVLARSIEGYLFGVNRVLWCKLTTGYCALLPQVKELEHDLEGEQRRRGDTEKNLRKQERRLKEVIYAAEEDHKNAERMQETVEKLQLKCKVFKRQVEETVSSAVKYGLE